MSYYNLPQAPGAYQGAVIKGPVNIYDEVQKDRSEIYGYVCGIPVIPLAYLVCGYMILEGIVILLHDPPNLMTGTFSKSEVGFLEVVAWGNIVFAVIGAVGIWFSHNLLPIGWRHTAKLHSAVAMLGAGLLLAWRSLVCLSVAPWAGVMMAFFIPSNERTWVFVVICAYIILSIFLVYLLALAFRQAYSDSKRLQKHLDSQALFERQQLLITAGNWRQDGRHLTGDMLTDAEVEPDLFGFLPLAETVFLYTLVITVASLWAFFHLIFTGHTSGGWAFFGHLPEVNSTFWIEAFLWMFSFFTALVGVAGASSFCGSGFIAEKSSTSSLLIFLVCSILRFGLLFAVTGMDILEKNTCGIYVAGLAKIAYRASSGVWLHCGGMDFLFILGVLLCCFLDGYMIWATFQLWHHAQDWTFESFDKDDYGAAPAVSED